MTNCVFFYIEVSFQIENSSFEPYDANLFDASFINYNRCWEKVDEQEPNFYSEDYYNGN